MFDVPGGDYLKVMSTAGATSSQRSIALDAFKRHLAEWQGDRALALKLKDHASVANRDVVYQCDDKCGSQWLTLPTNPAGRDNKAARREGRKLECTRGHPLVDEEDVHGSSLDPNKSNPVIPLCLWLRDTTGCQDTLSE